MLNLVLISFSPNILFFFLGNADPQQTLSGHIVFTTKRYHANVSVDVEDAFVGALLVQFGQNKLLHSKHNTVFTANTDGRAEHTQTHIRKSFNFGTDRVNTVGFI